MSLSIGGFSTMNYALSSTPSFSDAYTSSIKKNQPVTQYGNVDAVTPVVYPNAQEINGGRTVEQMQKAKSAAKAYNEVAAGFAGTFTGYDNSSSPYGYDMVGSTLDLFA